MRTPFRFVLPILAAVVTAGVLAASPAFADDAPPVAPSTRAILDALAAATISVSATDSLYEDRVEISWPNAGEFDVFYRVLRAGGAANDTTLLSVLSSEDSTYVDTGGDPGVNYRYIVRLVDVAADTLLDVGNDFGSRRINPPGSVSASDGTLSTRVRVTWSDFSFVEAGYRIFRRQGGAGPFVELGTVAEDGQIFDDMTAAQGITYDYRVRAFDAEGFESRFGQDSGWAGYVVPPGTVRATDGIFTDRVRISWVDQSPDETGFRVYRNGNLIGTVGIDETHYDDADSLDAAHVYAVAAVVDTGGPVLESVRISDSGIGGPATLAGADSLVATVDAFDDRVRLEWNDGADFEDSWIVKRNGSVIATLGPNTETFDDPDAAPGVSYVYGVHAQADSGGYSPTVTDNGRRAVILAPRNVSASDGTHEGFVEITWESDATSVVLFKIFRNGVPFKTVNGTARSAVDTDLPSEATRTYCVVAVTALETSSPSACDTGYRKLKAPTEVEASDNTYEDRVLVTWKDNSKVETGYNIYRRVQGAGSFALLGTRSAGRTAYIDSAAAPGRVYEYEVAAADPLGISARTRDAGSRKLAEPTYVEATDGAHERKIVLTWLDNSRHETGYEIRRKLAASASAPDSIARVAANVMVYEDAAITFGVEYQYTVVPFDALGRSPVGAEATDTGFSTILPPLSVNASDRYADKIIVTWADQSAIETGYRIERRQLGSSDGFTTLTTTAAGAETYQDVTASSGVEYEYCVRTVSGAVLSEPDCDTGVYRPAVAATDKVIDTFLAPSSVTAGSLFGQTLAVSGDHMIVGAPDMATNGKVTFFERTDSGWIQVAQFGPPATGNSDYGRLVAIDGDYAVVSGTDAKVHAYERTREGGWVYYGVTTIPCAWYSLAIQDGLIAVGSVADVNTPGNTQRAVCLYSIDGDGGLDFEAIIIDPASTLSSQFGDALAFGDGELFVGAPGLNAALNGSLVYSYRENNGTWPTTYSNFLFGQNAGFGSSLAVSGSNLMIGSPTEKYAYVYNDAATGSYVPTGFLTTTRAGAFGATVGIWGKYAAVGSPEGTGASAGSGAVHLFEMNADGTWDYFADDILVSSTASGQDDFGRSLALGEGTLFFGGPGDDVSGSNSGTVAVYELNVAPSDVSASDATYADRIQVKWRDRSTTDTQEDGFNVYRDGVLLETTGPNVQTFNDFDVQPGRAHEYSVASLRGGAESERIADFGRRAPNGAITGRVETQAGAAVNGVDVCLDPTPNGALLFDGTGTASSASVDIPGDFTLEFWVNTGDISTLKDWIQLRNSSGARFSMGISGQVAYVSAYATGATTPTTQTPVVQIGLPSDTWIHWALVVDQGSNIIVYKDGAPYDTLTIAAEVQGARTVRLGGFNGRLDDVRIWGTLRTASQIQDLHESPLTGDEDGLLAYWNLDEGEGDLAAELSPNEAYAVLAGGSHWSRAGAPLTACAVTDLEGNYVLGNLRYGESTTFKVTPQLPNRVFEPGFKTITLSTGAPVQNEVAFRDISSYTMNGFVRLTNVSLDPDAFCFSPNVEILVDGEVKGTTDGNGNFSVALTIGEHVVQPRFGDHTFSPASLTVNVLADTSGVQFVDTTVRTVAGRIGGGCDLDIGTLEIEIVSENGCFVKDDFTGSGDYEVQLPPQTYFLTVRDVTNIPTGMDKADILEFFENLGTREINLAEADTTLDFVYRAPIKMRITGFDPPLCATPPRNVPVLAQGDQVALTIEVFEDYGPGNECPVDSASVTVYDEIIDEADAPVVVTVENGVASYTTVANTPNVFAGRRDANGIDRSHQKPITAVADVGGIFATKTEWVIVTGHRPRVPTFTSISETIPILILRDPPGDNSFAFLEEGTSTCTEIRNLGLESLVTGLNTKVKGGLRFSKGTPFWSTDTEFAFETENEFRIGIEATQDDGVTICASATETFSTSSNEIFVGENGDIYLGVALNLIFAKTDVVEFDPVTCTIQKSEAITVGGDGQDPFETTYLYTGDHIKNVVIPQLRTLAAGVANPDSALIFASAADNWQTNHLDYNAQLKTDAEFVENRSFSAGADFTATSSVDTTETFTWSVKAFTGNELALAFVFDESGSGSSNQFFVGLNFEYTRVEGSETTSSRTVGYTLSDDDVGDFFSVDIKEDADYGTPVFEIVSGTSSCPWEPWYTATGEPRMQPRDTALLAVEPPELRDVPPDDPAVFTLSLSNDSQSGEAREYLLRAIQTTNPGGATLRINGSPLSGELSFFIGPQQTQEVTLSVERGPRRYLYEDLQIQIVAPCEYDRWRNGGPLPLADTVSVTVEFEAPCSEVSLFRPRSGWMHSASDGDTLEIILKDFEFRISEDDSIQSVGAEYRLLNTDIWYPIEEIGRANLPTDVDGNPQSVSILWDISNLAQEGRYEIRGFTRCEGGSNFSIPATGLLDRTPPTPFGAPQPADSVLSLGEEIKVTFQESILCESLNAANVTLFRVNADQSTTPVQANVACNGNAVIITPVSPTLAQLEGKTLVASLVGVKDLAGNFMKARNGSSTETWSFEVRQSAFTWAEGSLVREVAYRDPGSVSAILVNGSGEDLTFQIEDAPYWLTPDRAGATILRQNSLQIAFAVDGLLPLGSHQDTVKAVVRNNLNQVVRETPLFVQLEVVCRPPVWSIDPADFEQSMTVIAELSVGGQLSIDPDDRIAAFVGNQLRGVASPVYVSGPNRYLAFLTVYSNRVSGESVRFQIYDDSECRLYPSSNRALAFTGEGSFGTPNVPLLIVAQDAPPASINHIPVNEGWTWVSFNLRSPDMSVNGVLDDLNPISGDVVKSQTAFSQFDPNLGWTGGVATFNNTSAYLLKVSDAGTVALDGSPAPPDSTPIAVATGWNWIAYVPQTPLAVNVALAGLNPSDDDVIKGQDGFAQYYKVNNNVKGWYGDLQLMEPGKGYKLKLKNATNSGNSFRYPVPVAGPAVLAALSDTSVPVAVEAAAEASDLDWTLDPRAFQYNMTLTASVELDGTPVHGTSLVVAAFVGDEIRGVAGFQEIPGLYEARAFLMIHSNATEGESVSLRIYDPATQQVLGVEDRVAFAADGVLGNVREPFLVSTSRDAVIDGPGGEVRRFSLSRVTPNPLSAAATGTIRFSLPSDEHVSLRVFDVQGRELRTLIDERRDAGDHEIAFEAATLPAGVYFYRIQAGTFSQVHRVVVLN